MISTCIPTNAAGIANHLEKTARQVRDALWNLIDPGRGVLDDPDIEDQLEFRLQLRHGARLGIADRGEVLRVRKQNRLTVANPV
jgi:hypothetical protein